jgi:thiol:disulfide interchange protein DsbA
MYTMQHGIKRALAGACLSLGLGLAALPALAVEAGKDYVEIPPQPVETRTKVEVIEFFWYRCPHCAQLEPDLQAWLKKLPRNVQFKRQPAALNDGWLPLTRAYFALEALGLVDKLHAQVFHAIHDQGIDLNDPDTFFEWAEGKGVNRKRLENAYKSFAVATKASRAKQVAQSYRLSGVPAFVVNGRYVTSAYITGGHPQLFAALDGLIAREQIKLAKR